MTVRQFSSATVDQGEWTRLVHSAPEATFYHTFFWTTVWEKTFPSGTAHFFAVEEAGRYRSGLPAVRFSKRGLAEWHSLPFGTYGGVIGGDGATTEDRAICLEAFRQASREKKSRGAILVDFNGTQPLLPGGRATALETEIVHLPAGAPWFNLWTPMARRSYRKAMNLGLQIDYPHGLEDLSACFELVKLRSRRKKTAWNYPLSFYRELFQAHQNPALDPEAKVLWPVARKGEKVAAFQIFFQFRDQLIYWDGASLPEALPLRPNHLLFGSMFDWASRNGIQTINLGGSPGREKGLALFKRSLGGESYTYRQYRFPTALGKVVERAKKILR